MKAVKMRWIIIIFLIFLFSSCEKSNAENKAENEITSESELSFFGSDMEPILVDKIETGVIWYNTDITDIICNGFIDIYQFTYYVNQQISERLRYFETVLYDETPLYNIDGDAASFIKNLPSKTEIIILAKNNSRNDRFYLVKTKDSLNLWDGWIQSKYIGDNLNSEIDNIPYREKILNTLLTGVSTRDNLFADQTGWMGEFIFVRNNGEIICRVKHEEIIKIEPNAVDGRIIGWSKDNEKIWFYCNMDAYTVCFGIIDINLKRYAILDRPPSFGSNQYAIDIDTGIIYYTDYRFQFDQDTAKATKESGRIFHLYSYNFFTKKEVELDTNVGEGFIINYDEDHGFTYSKINSD
jgi:hypothetical protein